MSVSMMSGTGSAAAVAVAIITTATTSSCSLLVNAPRMISSVSRALMVKR